MITKRRTLILLLLSSLLLGVLAAQCGAATPAATEAPPQAEAKPTEAPKQEPPATVAVEAPKSSEAPASQAPAPAEKKKVTIKALVRNYTLDTDRPWRTAIPILQERHPDLDIDVQLEGTNYDDTRRKALLSLQAGQGYDIIIMDNIWLGEFVDGGLIRDVTDYFNAWKDKGDVPDFFRNTSTWNDKIYGLWLHSDIRTLHWNKELFKQFGLDPEKPPTTWDELAATGKKCTKAPANWGYAFPGGQEEATAERWYPFLWQLGGQILSDDFKKAAFNSEAGVKSVTFLGDLVNKDKITPRDITSAVYDDLEMQVITGNQYCMGIVVGTGYLTAGTDQYKTPEEYKKVRGATFLPVGPGGQKATGAGGWIMTVSAKSENPELAWEYLTIATSTDNAREYWYGEGRVPTRKTALDDVATFEKATAYFNIIAESVPIAHLSPQVPQYPQFLPFIITAVQRVILGEADPKKALDEAATQTDGVLSK
jgi:multiple sugar transport system substrate-binding protein